MWLRCDVCRRYARLKLAGLHDVDYRTKTFSCSACGSEAYFCLVEPTKEFGMHDYRLDEVEKPERHPDAVKRLTEPPRRTVSSTGANCPAARWMDGARPPSFPEAGSITASSGAAFCTLRAQAVIETNHCPLAFIRNPEGCPDDRVRPHANGT